MLYIPMHNPKKKKKIIHDRRETDRNNVPERKKVEVKRRVRGEAREGQAEQSERSCFYSLS